MRRFAAAILQAALVALLSPAHADSEINSGAIGASDTADTAPDDATAPVVVSAPEPRYVAPTLRDRIGRIWAPVLINGRGPFRLVLDTGATGIALIPSVIQALGLPFENSMRARLYGVTGTAVVPVVRIDSVEVGDFIAENLKVPIVADAFGGADGVLGGKGLRDKRIFVDFRHDSIRIERSRNRFDGVNFVRIPFRLESGHLPMFELRIGSVPTQAILDTGSQISIGNNRLLEALLRLRHDDQDATVIGVTLDKASVRSVSIPPIILSGLAISHLRITFGDVYIFNQWKLNDQPAMLIGMDVIGVLDQVVIDFKRRELLVRTRT